MLPKHTDILIVGAGPTGLALAAALQLKGVDHALIDALPEGQNTSQNGLQPLMRPFATCCRLS